MAAISVLALSRLANKPAVTLSAVGLALILGVMRVPFVQYLRPVGDLYVGLLQMCVLPFLLTTIPLAVRSAMTSGTGGDVIRKLLIWVGIVTGGVAITALVLPTIIFHLSAVDEGTIARIGALVGNSANLNDVAFSFAQPHAGGADLTSGTGLLAIVPTNIFAALSNNDSLRVLVFVAIFGIEMVLAERQSGQSVFGAMRHIQLVCIRIFDRFNILVPIGIIALIAPRVAVMGSEVFAVLAMLAYAFLASSVAVLIATFVAVIVSLRHSPRFVFPILLKPIMLGAATGSSLICIPQTLETMKDELKTSAGPCDLFIPVGMATLRCGTILYFIVVTLFMGALIGREFSVLDLALVAALSTMASFATLGASGLAALAPLAPVLRQFGLSYELAVPLIIILEPIANMVRTMVNVAIICAIPALSGGREAGMLIPVAAE